MPPYAGMTNYDRVSEGEGRALRSRSYTTQRGRAATKRVDSAKGHVRTIQIPPAPLCKGGLGGFQRIYSQLDFLNKISRSCKLVAQGKGGGEKIG
jgi:hypothetical protein